ncbi:MAG: hypothetical protein LBJ87_02635, partial [bacterium]|nr:hypothetical protein [bacterium]
MTTREPMAEQLRRRFGLQDAVLVTDRGMVSADNVAALAAGGERSILALRCRRQVEGELALVLAQTGRPAPTMRREAPWDWREVDLTSGSSRRK